MHEIALLLQLENEQLRESLRESLANTEAAIALIERLRARVAELEAEAVERRPVA